MFSVCPSHSPFFDGKVKLYLHIDLISSMQTRTMASFDSVTHTAQSAVVGRRSVNKNDKSLEKIEGGQNFLLPFALNAFTLEVYHIHLSHTDLLNSLFIV